MAIIYKKCPKCNSKNVVPIVYGEPSYEAYVNLEEEKVFHGGCCVAIDDNGISMYEYHCKDCEYEYNKNDAINNVYSKIRNIKGYIGGFFQGHKHFEINFLTGEVFFYEGFDEEDNKLIRKANSKEIKALIEKLKKINILNWKKEYEDKDILDGTQWSITIDVDGRKRIKHGCNMFPNEWHLFCNIISKLLEREFY